MAKLRSLSMFMSRELMQAMAAAESDAFIHNRAGHYGYKANRPVSKHPKKKRK